MRNGDTRGGVDFVQQADMTAALVLYEKAGVLYPLAGGWGGSLRRCYVGYFFAV